MFMIGMMANRRFSYYLLCSGLVWLLVSCTGDGEQMHQQLETLEQQISNGEKLLNDSLAESLVAYFDRHGEDRKSVV